MAYSDYGGYAYRNGERLEDRSDVVLSPEGIKSTPGQWPGWTLPEGRCGGSYHVLLGDGPIFVGLYKQSGMSIHRLGEEIEPADLMLDSPDGAVSIGEWDGKPYRYINSDHFIAEGVPCVLFVDGCRIDVHWLVSDNHYQFVRLEQPDGTVWHGFSGYGVGAGLEGAGYGYSTDDQVAQLNRIWPGATSAS